MNRADKALERKLDGYAQFLRKRQLALPKHQPHLVRWVRELLVFATEHRGGMGMKLRYMIEYALRDRIPAYRHCVAVAGRREPRYEPVGVWVQGPGLGLDLVIEFLPGNTEAREEAEWIVNRLVENEVRTLPDDFLAYHQVTLSPYRGMRGPVIETEAFLPAEACAGGLLQRFWSTFGFFVCNRFSME